MLSSLVDRIIQLIPPGVLARTLKFIPRPIFDWKKEAAFSRIVRYVYKNSKFYRSKFDKLKIDPCKVRRPTDLGDFYTTSTDIVEHAEDFLCEKPGIVFESSGT